MMPTLFDVPFLNLPIRGYGLMMMIGILTAIYIAAKRAVRVKADPDIILNAGFIALIGGVVGARAFYVLHYWERFAQTERPLLEAINITGGGLEFYGGFLAVFVLVAGYLLWKRVSVRLYLDLMAPSLMWGLAWGRLGCFLNGCCYGAVCVTAAGQPAVPWAVRFPYSSPAYYDQWRAGQLTAPAELMFVDSIGSARPISRDHLSMSTEELLGPKKQYDAQLERVEEARRRNAPAEELAPLERKLKAAAERLQKHQKALSDLDGVTGVFSGRSRIGKAYTPSEIRDLANKAENHSLPVHPTQIYATINALLLFFVLSAVLARRKRHGVVLPLLFMLYAVARMVEEMIRVDNPIDSAGLTISQFISVCGFVFGAVWLAILYRLPLRSPRAVAYVAPEAPAGASPAKV